MPRWMWVSALVVVWVLASCAGTGPESAPEPAEEDGFDRAMLGRWDGTVLGDDPYPLWFELSGNGETLGGRLQPRGGHALAFDHVEASGSTLVMQVGEVHYQGTFDGERFRGTGSRGEASFDWVAVRAPELPAPENPSWGEPIELSDLTDWVTLGDAESQWRAEDGMLVNEASGANLRTEDTFFDFKLHVEVNVPEGSNSGIYLRGRHEVQVVDPGEEVMDVQRMGAIYGQIAPSQDATLPAGEWQTFDITLLGRWVTVILNGETIIDHQEIPGITGGALDSDEGAPGPIYLQGDHGPVRYRNIVLTPTTS